MALHPEFHLFVSNFLLMFCYFHSLSCRYKMLKLYSMYACLSFISIFEVTNIPPLSAACIPPWSLSLPLGEVNGFIGQLKQEGPPEPYQFPVHLCRRGWTWPKSTPDLLGSSCSPGVFFLFPLSAFDSQDVGLCDGIIQLKTKTSDQYQT